MTFKTSFFLKTILVYFTISSPLTLFANTDELLTTPVISIANVKKKNNKERVLLRGIVKEFTSKNEFILIDPHNTTETIKIKLSKLTKIEGYSSIEDLEGCMVSIDAIVIKKPNMPLVLLDALKINGK